MTYSYALYLLGGKNMGNFILRRIRHVNAIINLTSLGTLEIKETETDRMIFSYNFTGQFRQDSGYTL